MILIGKKWVRPESIEAVEYDDVGEPGAVWVVRAISRQDCYVAGEYATEEAASVAAAGLARAIEAACHFPLVPSNRKEKMRRDGRG